MLHSGRRSKTAGLAAALVLTLACGSGGSDNPNAPSPTTLIGDWTGTITRPNGAGVFDVRWAATLNGDQLSGTVTFTKDNLVNPGNGVGMFSGNSSGTRVALFLRTQGTPIPGRTIGCSIDVTSAPGPSSGVPASATELRGTVDLLITSCDQYGLANVTSEPVEIVLRK